MIRSASKLRKLGEDHRRYLLERGVAEIIVLSELVDLLDDGRPLRLKMGFDPSAPDLTLGHAVGLRKLRQFQELGHKVVVIVGDWTAQIGDPSGESKARLMLTAEEVHGNAETYLSQFFKVVDIERTEVRWQSEWFGTFTLSDVINLTNHFTVAQFLGRDDFAKRMATHQPVGLTELIYPLLQAYDSVVVESDVEFGGTDQRLNILAARDLQRMIGRRPQQCFLMTLLVGTDGVQKMSKSLGNYIALNDPPSEIFGKTMSLPDETILPYLESLTDVPGPELEELKSVLESGSVNPMDAKKRLARELVAQFYDTSSAAKAEANFERTVQHGDLPDEIQTHDLPVGAEIERKRLSDILVAAHLAASSSEARRLIDQGAVRINEEPAAGNLPARALVDNDIIRVGRRRFVRITSCSIPR